MVDRAEADEEVERAVYDEFSVCLLCLRDWLVGWWDGCCLFG